MQDPRCVGLSRVYASIDHDRFLGRLGRKVSNREQGYRNSTQASLDSLLLKDRTEFLILMLNFLYVLYE